MELLVLGGEALPREMSKQVVAVGRRGGTSMGERRRRCGPGLGGWEERER